MTFSRLNLTLPFIYKPLTDRVKLGEGGLVIFNALHSIWANKSASLAAIESIVSLLVITLLYGFNDYVDRSADLQNPKKDKFFIQAINQHPSFFLSLNLGLSLVSLAVVYVLLSPEKALLLLSLFLVNAVYSLWLKSLFLLDMIIVIAWGALYALLAGPWNWHLALITGVMTGIAHIFQMVTDKQVDAINKVNTSAVRLPLALPIAMALLCIVTGLLLQTQLSLFWGVTAGLPFLFFIFGNNITLSWHASRMYFAICWLALLITTYGNF